LFNGVAFGRLTRSIYIIRFSSLSTLLVLGEGLFPIYILAILFESMCTIYIYNVIN
jgi:hypothetical protein